MSAQPDKAIRPVGRRAQRQRDTRGRLIKAGYHIMSEVGVDSAKISAITDSAEVGFGTFYNYFDDKDDLASQVLDCVIDDFGRRNDIMIRRMMPEDPALVVPLSARMFLRAALAAPLWQWWALRPDLLADRMSLGFGPFAMRDLRQSVRRSVIDIATEDVPEIWNLCVWIMVGGIHDFSCRPSYHASETLIAEAVARVIGLSKKSMDALRAFELPDYPEPDIDWHFRLS